MKHSKSENAFRIAASLLAFNEDIPAWKNVICVASQLTWELPQQVLGILYAQVINVFGGVDFVDRFHGALRVRTNFGGGMALGNVMSSSADSLDRHEWGHTMQSRIFGPLYLPVFAIPSFVRATIIEVVKLAGGLKNFSHSDYYNFYTESFADYLSEKFLVTKL